MTSASQGKRADSYMKFLDKDGVDSTGTVFLNNGRVILRGSGLLAAVLFDHGYYREDSLGTGLRIGERPRLKKRQLRL